VTNALPDNFVKIQNFVDGQPDIVLVDGKRVVGGRVDGHATYFLTEAGEVVGPLFSRAGASAGGTEAQLTITFRLSHG